MFMYQDVYEHGYVKIDKSKIICYNRKHNLRVYLGFNNPSDKGQLKYSNCLHEVIYI